MSAPEPKPAASLSPTLIRRGQGRAAPALAAPPGAETGPSDMRDLAIPPAPDVREGTRKGRTRRFVSWRSAGMFGVLYVAALVLFAAAFDMWPH